VEWKEQDVSKASQELEFYSKLSGAQCPEEAIKAVARHEVIKWQKEIPYDVVRP